MTKHPYFASAPPTNVPRHTSAEPSPLEVVEHDKSLLDQGLAETVPASDPVAAMPRSLATHEPASLPPVHTADAGDPSRERKLAHGEISGCAIGDDEASELKALAAPLHCDLCHREIPTTVAFNFEGADYVYHFCGAQCLADWCKSANTHEK
ncbi:MAG: DUF3330 domain-containing protein [Candidatus Dechloromonas phosphoritropha]